MDARIDAPSLNTRGHPPPTGIYEGLRYTLDSWNISHTMLSDAIWSYLFACSALRDTYSTLSRTTPSEELENVLTTISQRLDRLACEEELLRDMRISFTSLRNQSKTLAPINKLPVEILGHVFAFSKTYCIAEKSNRPLYGNLTSVCTYWRQVALNKSDLWTHIDIGFDTPVGLSRLSLERAKSSPIHVHVRELEGEDDEELSEEAADKIIVVLAPHMHRVYSLDIELESFTHGFIQSVLDVWLSQGNENLARKLSVKRPEYSVAFQYIPESDNVVLENTDRTLRALNTLHLKDLEFGWHSSAYRDLIDLRLELGEDSDSTISLPRLYSVLSANPILATLKIAWLDITCPEEWIQPPRIVLSCLRTLSVERMRSIDTRALLPLLALPGASGELSVTLLIDDETLDVAAEFLAHSRVTTLSLEFEPCNYTLLFQPASSRSPIMPLTLILGVDDLDEALVSEGNLTFLQNPSLWYIPSIILYDCIVSQQALERLITLHSVRSLWLDSCTARRRGPPLEIIRTSLLELHPELQWPTSAAHSVELKYQRYILDMFD